MSSRSLEDYAASKLRSLERRSLKREIATIDRASEARVQTAGGTLVSFSCNDYLGLASDPATAAASIEATERLGTGAGASRLITGSHSPYTELERSLADLKETEDAVVFGSGYLANIGIVPLFAGRPDLVLIDELAHSCMIAGADLSGAKVVTFAHNDADAARRELEKRRSRHRHCLILTEGVFSMEGDLAPLPVLAELADRHDAWLMTDDAHGLGVVGSGRGSTYAHGDRVDVPLQMGTLSKAAGSYGGYLCASHGICELVRNRARSFVFSTGLPPGAVAAATRALAIIREDPARVARPLALARRCTAALGWPDAVSAIVPLVLGPSDAALAASAALGRAGFLVTAIRPPTVPVGTARLRFTFSAAHTDDDVDALIGAVRELGLLPVAARRERVAGARR
ncbi:MAG TPA: 8-amino-7-oxononanoate synthase [Gammaproteobacteria bacterium]|nr:8-amino-7-oxononanoate synthase [Gammaproteobacteria bacterium]